MLLFHVKCLLVQKGKCSDVSGFSLTFPPHESPLNWVPLRKELMILSLARIPATDFLF